MTEEKYQVGSLTGRFDMDNDGDVDAADVRAVGIGVFTWAMANKTKALGLAIGVAMLMGLSALGGDAIDLLSATVGAVSGM